jgi:DNA mismatch repair ATPase MutL
VWLITVVVLPHPAIHFTLKHNGRVIHALPPEETSQHRIHQLFGEDIARDLMRQRFFGLLRKNNCRNHAKNSNQTKRKYSHLNFYLSG